MRFREIEKIVLDDGWILVDVRGSHYQYKHPTKTGRSQMRAATLDERRLI